MVTNENDGMAARLASAKSELEDNLNTLDFNKIRKAIEKAVSRESLSELSGKLRDATYDYDDLEFKHNALLKEEKVLIGQIKRKTKEFEALQKERDKLIKLNEELENQSKLKISNIEKEKKDNDIENFFKVQDVLDKVREKKKEVSDYLMEKYKVKK